MTHECKQEERLRSVETQSATLYERIENLSKSLERVAAKMDKFTNAILGLIITTIIGFLSGVAVLVIGGIILWIIKMQ